MSQLAIVGRCPQGPRSESYPRSSPDSTPSLSPIYYSLHSFKSKSCANAQWRTVREAKDHKHHCWKLLSLKSNQKSSLSLETKGGIASIWRWPESCSVVRNEMKMKGFVTKLSRLVWRTLRSSYFQQNPDTYSISTLCSRVCDNVGLFY